LLLILSFSSPDQKDKFEYIYSSYKRLMLSKAYGILHDYMLAEDAASEAFIRIYKNIDKIDDPGSNSSIAFVLTIVKNTSLSLLEREQKHRADEIPETMQDETYSLEEQVIGQISAKEIQKAVNTLPEDLKAVFLLKYGNDLSHREIGRLLDISENNVTVRLHRAKKKIADFLKGVYR